MKSAKWTKEIPKEEWWYWVKYRFDGSNIICPAVVNIWEDRVSVRSGRNGHVFRLSKSGEYFETLDCRPVKSLRFGSKVEIPMDLLRR